MVVSTGPRSLESRPPSSLSRIRMCREMMCTRAGLFTSLRVSHRIVSLGRLHGCVLRNSILRLHSRDLRTPNRRNKPMRSPNPAPFPQRFGLGNGKPMDPSWLRHRHLQESPRKADQFLKHNASLPLPRHRRLHQCNLLRRSSQSTVPCTILRVKRQVNCRSKRAKSSISRERRIQVSLFPVTILTPRMVAC